MTTADRLVKDYVVSRGWRPGTTLENRAARLWDRMGLRPEDVEQQYKVGPYRLDFAFVDQKIVVECDGWHHRRPETAAKDAERDAYLRNQGWVVFRVDDTNGTDGLRDQLANVGRIIAVLRKFDPKSPRRGR